MNLKKVLTPTTVSVDLPGTDKREVIEALIDLATQGGKVRPATRRSRASWSVSAR